MISVEAREKRIHLVLDLSATQVRLHADPARLQQVFWNLIRNAVKFTPEGGRVQIRTSNSPGVASAPPGTSLLTIEVADTGIGFEPGSTPLRFQPFERGHAQDVRFPGLGLGLTIARAIIDLHGGRIHATSEGPSRGACFTVELPGAVRPATVAGEPAHGKAHGPLPALRLLVVEDHDATRDVLARLLRREGHTVAAAASVTEALATAGKQTFDLVLSDLGLPDGTGLELVAELRARHGLLGIALSGYGMDEDLRRSHDAGFFAHLIKPVEVKELRRTLTAFVARQNDRATVATP
jgi:CheY-like chemotaxis protein/anti-sigma regulatory factor (Ser/Thr protein kinase)